MHATCRAASMSNRWMRRASPPRPTHAYSRRYMASRRGVIAPFFPHTAECLLLTAPRLGKGAQFHNQLSVRACKADLMRYQANWMNTDALMGSSAIRACGHAPPGARWPFCVMPSWMAWYAT